MQDTIKRKNIALILVLFVCIVTLVFSDFGKPTTVIYDCGMAEWHPDVPKEVKEKCRELNRSKYLTLTLNSAIIKT